VAECHARSDVDVVKVSLKKLGMDGAIANTFLARFVNILGSTGTVLLIVRFLNPVEQGYYYTLLSLVSLQMVFELGFSFVIQQLAAHECVHLHLKQDGIVEGESKAHARLSSVLRLSVRWYTVAGLAMMLVLGPLGFLFFAHHSGSSTEARWHGPWFSAVIASSVGLWCMPFYAFLEGCGLIRQVAGMRLRQSTAASLLAWAGMLLHHGLYSPALVILGQVGVGLVFLTRHRGLLIGLLHHSSGDNPVLWGTEVWPFQWRIAVSWLCSYFTAFVLIPMVFALRGPAEAGQIGMSVSITGFMVSLALPWTSTKMTPFGQLVARSAFHELDRLFLRTMAQSMLVFTVIGACACVCAAVLPLTFPRIAARMVSPQLFAALVLAAGINCAVQNMATLLRCFKREPFLWQSLAVSAMTVLLVYLSAPRWGNVGVVTAYLGVSAGVGLPIAATIFLSRRRAYLTVSSTIGTVNQGHILVG
jgi:hypothetical protein